MATTPAIPRGEPRARASYHRKKTSDRLDAAIRVRQNAICKMGISAGWRVGYPTGHPSVLSGATDRRGLSAADHASGVLLWLLWCDVGLAVDVPGDRLQPDSLPNGHAAGHVGEGEFRRRHPSSVRVRPSRWRVARLCGDGRNLAGAVRDRLPVDAEGTAPGQQALSGIETLRCAISRS